MADEEQIKDTHSDTIERSDDIDTGRRESMRESIKSAYREHGGTPSDGEDPRGPPVSAKTASVVRSQKAAPLAPLAKPPADAATKNRETEHRIARDSADAARSPRPLAKTAPTHRTDCLGVAAKAESKTCRQRSSRPSSSASRTSRAASSS